MRFNVGEVWKSIGSVPERRAVVIEIADDGRTGTLFFDDGEQRSFLWAELTQAGKWQVDDSPKPVLSGGQLKEMILRQIRAYPECPGGMSVEINPLQGDDWEALSVSPPGQSIAYADCVNRIASIARELRQLYGVRTLRVVAEARLPMASSASVIASTGAPPIRSERPAHLEPAVRALGIDVSAPTIVSVDAASARASDLASVIGSKISEHPTDVQAAARALSKAIRDQITALNASVPPNDPDLHKQQNDFAAFLESIADGLNELAEALDQAVAAGAPEKPQPVLLGRAGDLARSLGTTVIEGLKRDQNYIMDCAIKFSVFGLGFVFLRSIGVDGVVASVASGLMNVNLAKSEKTKE